METLSSSSVRWRENVALKQFKNYKRLKEDFKLDLNGKIQIKTKKCCMQDFLNFLTYSYANGNDLILLTVENDKTKATLTHMYIKLVISKPTTWSVWA